MASPFTRFFSFFLVLFFITLLLLLLVARNTTVSFSLQTKNTIMNNITPRIWQKCIQERCRLSKTRLFTTSTTDQKQVIPRAAVSVVVMHSKDKENKYVLVQRGKEPNKGMWSLPGGKIEVGETSLAAAKRELWEETGLGALNKNENNVFELHWCEDGPVCTTDSIHKSRSKDNDLSGEKILFHYVISQWFVEAKSIGQTENSMLPPKLRASDDAADAKWWNLKAIQEGIRTGEVTSGVEKVILRAELMYDKGLLS